MITTIDKCVVLIPTRSEPAIKETLASVAKQTLRPFMTVVVLNNCNDEGETKRLIGEASAEYGLSVTVLEMEHNAHMKAGALNYGYEWIRQNYGSIEYLVQMDADSELDERFVQNTLKAFNKPTNQTIGALSCTFIGKPNLAETRWQSAVMWLQRLEYIRFHDSTLMRNVSVVSGTGCALRIKALEEIRNERGYIWAIDSLVEDYEITLKLRSLSWQTRKSDLFKVHTDLMPSIRSLIKQRERWQRGTLDELGRYGFTKFTAADHLKQWLHGAGMILNIVACTLLAILLAMGLFQPSPILLALTFIIMVRQGYHARALGWQTAVCAATLIPDIVYGSIRNFWWVKALALSLGKSEKRWT